MGLWVFDGHSGSDLPGRAFVPFFIEEEKEEEEKFFIDIEDFEKECKGMLHEDENYILLVLLKFFFFLKLGPPLSASLEFWKANPIMDSRSLLEIFLRITLVLRRVIYISRARKKEASGTVLLRSGPTSKERGQAGYGSN